MLTSTTDLTATPTPYRTNLISSEEPVGAELLNRVPRHLDVKRIQSCGIDAHWSHGGLC